MGTALSRMAEKAKLNRNTAAQTVGNETPEESNSTADTALNVEVAEKSKKQTTKKSKPTPNRKKRASPSSDEEDDSKFDEKPRERTKKRTVSGKTGGTRRNNAGATS